MKCQLLNSDSCGTHKFTAATLACTRPLQEESSQTSSMGGGGASEAPAPAEKLLTVDSF